MPKVDKLGERKAIHGEKMIEIKIRFWTNNIAKKEGNIIPKHAWSSGVVRVEGNSLHEITPGKPKPFHTLLDLPSVIEKTFISHGIKLHISEKMLKYFE